MTNEEAKKMLKAKLECLKNETSGINHDCNMRLCDGCSLNYEQGNMGEQKEALEMAIQALEQQPCEDCISRQAVLDIINFEDEWLHDANSHNADTKIAFNGLESRVKEVPSVTPKAEWVPVSERLPEEGEPILFSTKTGGVYEGAYFDLCDNRQWYVYRDENYAWNNVITAWMPLPQPYKESDNNDMS